MAATAPSPVLAPRHAAYVDPATLPSTNLVDIHFGLLVATHVTMLLLTSAFVGLRLYVRRVIVKEIALDDWLLLSAEASYIIYIAFMFGYGIQIEIYGLQKVFWETLRICSLWEVPLVVTMVLVRAAIAAFFVRILPAVDNRVIRIVIAVIFCLYAVFMITYLFLITFQCGNPLAKRYNYYPYCISGPFIDNLPIVARIVTVSLDWIVTFLPIMVIVRSTLSTKDKLSVIGLMLLAGLGSTISVLSIVFNNLGLYLGPRSFGDFTIYSLFSLLENGVAIIVLSLAALRPLIRNIFAERIKARRRSSANINAAWLTSGPPVQGISPAEKDNGLVFMTYFKTQQQYSLPIRPPRPDSPF